jgi:hypothetical protein
MAETVKVSLLQPRAHRESKNEPYTHYKSGIVEMPVEHARSMGLMHRIVQVSGEGDATVTTRDPFAANFDEKLTRILNAAGYNTLEDLRGATYDQLISIDGVGPAAYERIQRALKGGK